MPAQTPEDVDRLFGEYVNAGDAEGVVALYERGATLLTESGPATGHAAIREFVTVFLAMKPRIQTSVEKVVAGGGDVAAVYNNWTLTLAGPDGQAIATGGKATEIVRRQSDGTWLFVIDDPNMRT